MQRLQELEVVAMARVAIASTANPLLSIFNLFISLVLTQPTPPSLWKRGGLVSDYDSIVLPIGLLVLVCALPFLTGGALVLLPGG